MLRNSRNVIFLFVFWLNVYKVSSQTSENRSLAEETEINIVDTYLVYKTVSVPFMKNVTAVPLITYKTCLLKPQKGPCRANITMHYFIPENKTCGVFKWGGCQGNGNRFDSERDCRNYCLINSDASRVMPSYCHLTFDYGYCFGSTERWFFDKQWKTCKKTIYSGCGGNKNNFYSREQCDSVCRLRKGPLKYKFDSELETSGLKFLIINPPDATTKRNFGSNAIGTT